MTFRRAPGGRQLGVGILQNVLDEAVCPRPDVAPGVQGLPRTVNGCGLAVDRSVTKARGCGSDDRVLKQGRITVVSRRGPGVEGGVGRFLEKNKTLQNIV